MRNFAGLRQEFLGIMINKKYFFNILRKLTLRIVLVRLKRGN